ncbi:MAG: biotin transporter BioY [Planctomycetota bacterium]
MSQTNDGERAVPTTEPGALESLSDLAATHANALRIAGVFVFVWLTWLGAHIAIPTPPFGIPVTLQTLAVLLAALTLGPKYGSISMLSYIVLGAIGLPLFAEGEAGLAVLKGQTAGYIIGFFLCQPVIAAIARGRDGAARGWGAMILACVAGHMVIFAVGVPWLYISRATWIGDPISLRDAVHYGMVIFLPGLVLKSGIAVLIGRWVAPWASRRIW